jgi:cell division protein ZapA (FtsZ GTPase activity inhibitor)
MKKSAVLTLVTLFFMVTIQCSKTSIISVNEDIEVDERVRNIQSYMRSKGRSLTLAGINYLQNLPNLESECELGENEVNSLKTALLNSLESSLDGDYQGLYTATLDSYNVAPSSFGWNPTFEWDNPEIIEPSLSSNVVSRLNSIRERIGNIGTDFIDEHENNQTDFDEDDYSSLMQTFVDSTIEAISEDEGLTTDEKVGLIAGLETLHALMPVISTSLGENLDCIYDGWSESNQRRFWQKVRNFVNAAVNIQTNVVVSAVRNAFDIRTIMVSTVVCGGAPPCIVTGMAVWATFGGVVGLVDGLNQTISGCYKYCLFRCTRKPSCL